MAPPQYNFSKVNLMILDPERSSARMVAGMLSGFGLNDPYLMHNSDDASAFLGTGGADAAILTMGRDPDAILDIIQKVRAIPVGDARFMPIIVLTGAAQPETVATLRDAGASFVVRRPIAPATLFDRLVWAAYSDKKFVQTRTYRGPDRRFRDKEPPPGGERRARASIQGCSHRSQDICEV